MGPVNDPSTMFKYRVVSAVGRERLHSPVGANDVTAVTLGAELDLTRILLPAGVDPYTTAIHCPRP